MPAKQPKPDPSRTTGPVSRRNFIAGTSAAAVSLSIVKPGLVRGYAANAKVDLAVIGCGGRGAWITNLFVQHGGYNITALADYFPDRLEGVANKFDVAPARRYSGLSGYQRMLKQKPDAVAVESPPYFHPVQAADAVDAGCHVYLAKPIAVDAPGCKTVDASGKKATADGLCFLVDFQTRADAFYVEALKRVHAGALGRLAFGEATYHAGVPWKGQIADARSNWNNPEYRLRSWGLDRILSGDIITEQNIHTLDVASWIMNGPPERAFGTGGQKVRDFGTCRDTFSVVFEYPDNIGITFSSRQFEGHGTQPDGIRNRMFGSQGVLETQYGGQVQIRGQHPYPGGSSPGIYKQGAVNNIAAFHAAIQNADCANATVEESVRSNLLTILGRTAAYENRVVTWKEILSSDQRLVANLKGLKS